MTEQEFTEANGDAHAGQAAGDAAAAIGDGIREAGDYVKRQWRESPLQVAAVFAAAGLLLGLLLRRR